MTRSVLDTHAARDRPARVRFVVLLAAAIGALWFVPGAHAFKVEKWEAGTCKESTCTDAGSHAAFYTQAAGHPNFGITDFEFSYTESGLPAAKHPVGKVKDVRVDLPPGLAVNPEAAGTCTEAQLNEHKCPENSKVGEDEATGTATVYALLGLNDTVTEHFPVYDMVHETGHPARFAVEINSPTLEALALLGDHLQGHLYLEAGISWHSEPATSENSGVASDDYHEFFKIENIPQQPEVVESRLIFNGVVDGHAFLTLPSTCATNPITTLHVDSYEAPGSFQEYQNETPVKATGCNALAFNPKLALTAEDSQSDQPDGVSAELQIPQGTDEPSKPNSPDVQTAEVTLPEGMTLNPSAAKGLEGCSDEQFAGETCPAASKVGSFAVARSPAAFTWARPSRVRTPNPAKSSGSSFTGTRRNTALDCTWKVASRRTPPPAA